MKIIANNFICRAYERSLMATQTKDPYIYVEHDYVELTGDLENVIVKADTPSVQLFIQANIEAFKKAYPEMDWSLV